VTVPPPGPARARPGLLVGATLALFLVWSHTFLAFEVLLAPARGPAPMDWLDLVVARMVPVGVVCAAWCFGARRAASLAILRRHPVRLLVCGLASVPLYNGVLYFGIERHVSGPVASLLTTLSPLYLVVIAWLFLGERLTFRKATGLALGLAGVVVIALARTAGAPASPGAVALVAAAPLAWSVHTALTKQVAHEHAPVLWTYLVLVVGALPLLPLVPWHGGPALAGLDAKGLLLLAYLVVFATVGGNAVWTWLLRHLPASTVGLTIFLNPPLTTAGKWVLSQVRPDVFTFAITPQEWVGGAVSLLGVAVAVLRRPGVRT
jgi:drug/metabolite transporter (DMT)-like permease